MISHCDNFETSPLNQAVFIEPTTLHVEILNIKHTIIEIINLISRGFIYRFNLSL